MWLKVKEDRNRWVHCRYGKDQATFSVGPEAVELRDDVGRYLLSLFASDVEQVEPEEEVSGPMEEQPRIVEPSRVGKRDFECPACHRNCHTKLGLEAHKATHTEEQLNRVP